MKKIILLLSIASVFAACKNNSNSALEANKNLVLVDTTGLSTNNAMTDVSTGRNIVVSTTPVVTTPVVTTPVATTPVVATTQRSRASNHAVYSTVPKRDKGWSSAAKGTAVGAGTGAIVGALVSKNKGTGAIVGALIGGGGGYLFGRHKDKKSGRVARHRARKAAGY